ncbi:hypothetical protein DdX_19061 [Ditylenchus destructor]|uniref:Uncharacterized protein n=1 Tax=Ditylenchus destructor TaxID=166010 RepID=A0AAD4QXI1_9BILA|nr:hypothetical protein DdX_19061 [Ditylenchus destructor]
MKNFDLLMDDCITRMDMNAFCVPWLSWNSKSILSHGSSTPKYHLYPRVSSVHKCQKRAGVDIILIHGRIRRISQRWTCPRIVTHQIRPGMAEFVLDHNIVAMIDIAEVAEFASVEAS